MIEGIQYLNVERFDNLDFDRYLEVKGYSFSFLKREDGGLEPEFKPGAMVKLGKLVDDILTGGRVDMLDPQFRKAQKIAQKISDMFGDAIKRFEKQVSFSADMVFRGIGMRSSGRLDFLWPRKAIIDLKVTSDKDVDAAIRRWGYAEQTWHYAKLANVPRRYIMIYSVPLDAVFLRDMGELEEHNRFWEDKVLKFGTVAKAA
jgi:hypothetical protein